MTHDAALSNRPLRRPELPRLRSSLRRSRLREAGHGVWDGRRPDALPQRPSRLRKAAPLGWAGARRDATRIGGSGVDLRARRRLDGRVVPVDPASSPGPRYLTPPSAAAAALSAARSTGLVRSFYLRTLAWAFGILSSIRVAAYLPTMWSIHLSADSSQHSLLTWLTWTAANLTMAAWLYEQTGHRVDRAIVVSLGNAAMCGTSSVLIVWYRL